MHIFAYIIHNFTISHAYIIIHENNTVYINSKMCNFIHVNIYSYTVKDITKPCGSLSTS